MKLLLHDGTQVDKKKSFLGNITGKLKSAGINALKGVGSALDAIPPSIDIIPPGTTLPSGLPIGQLDNIAIGGLAFANKGIKSLTKADDVARAGKEAVGAVKTIEKLPKALEGSKNIISSGKGVLSKIIQKVQGLQKSLGHTPQLKTEIGSLGKDIPPVLESQDPIQKIIRAIKDAKPVRKGQEALYSAERAKRVARAEAMGSKISGEKGYFAQLGQLKGELPKSQYESIRPKLEQTDIDTVFNKVRDAKFLTVFDKINAQGALTKIFGEKGGTVPTEGEIRQLEGLFGKDFAKSILDKRGSWDKIKEGLVQAISVPKSLMASMDMSAPFRQGAFLIGHPKQFFGAFKNMFSAFGSDKAYQGIMENIASRPSYKIMRENKLALTDMGYSLSGREEQFMSNWAEKIPIVGRGVKASNRAYSGFLNKLRADVFDNLLNKATSQGLDPKKNPLLTKDLATFINSATGRGDIQILQKALPALNAVMFSPRLMMSRLNLLNPVFYAKLDPFVRKEALKSLVSFGGTALTILGLAKMAGADVGADPRSADFGKIKIGNTRMDISAGFNQYLRAASQLYTGQIVSSTTGRTMTLGEGYKPMTRPDIVFNFFRSKQNPIISLMTSLASGQDAIGKPISAPQAIMNSVTPLVWQDMDELYKEQGIEGMPLAIPALFGAGVQTYGYEPQGKKEQTKQKQLINSGMTVKEANEFLLKRKKIEIDKIEQKDKTKKGLGDSKKIILH